ncbi:MAG: YihY/virulence factor BrkB family protein [Rhodocyclaceae bacterium]
MHALKSIGRIVYQAAVSWSDHRCTSIGAALAYYAIFSLAPILVIALSISGIVFGRDAVEGRVLQELAGLIGTDGASLIQRMIQASYISGHSLKASLIGIFGVLLGATGLFMELDYAFERIFEAQRKYRNAFFSLVMGRLRGLAIVVGVGFLLIVSLIASAAIVAASRYLTSWVGEWLRAASLLEAAFSLIFLTALFGLMFRLLAPVRLSWRTLAGGAFVTALLFTMGKWAVGLYLGAGAIGSTFGAAGSLAILLAWIYYVSMIVLFGAEVTHMLFREQTRLAETHKAARMAIMRDAPPAPSTPTPVP